MVQTAYIIGKVMARIDIRDFGSGNAGTTNTIRVLGPKAGIMVFLCDIIKGGLAFTLCAVLFNGSGSFLMGSSVLPGVYGGLGAILGHCFPFYLKFKGGKGMAAAIGLMLCLDVKSALIAYAVGIATVAVTRYISLATLIVIAIYPVILWLFKFEIECIMVLFVIACLIWYLHRANIGRLLKGTENKFNFKKQV
jgi:glycerol-3-phosphate acyltransferase PlsY